MKDDSIGTRPWPSSGLMRAALAVGLSLLAACADTLSGSRAAMAADATGGAQPPLVTAAQKGDKAAVMILSALAKFRGSQEEATHWSLLGTEFGHSGSAHEMAIAYEEKGDVQKAAYWYRRDLELQPTFPGPSAYRLAELILAGRGPGTREEGAELMYYSAAAGSSQAARRLSALLMAGDGIGRSEDDASLWLARVERAESFGTPPLVPPPAESPPSCPPSQTERLRDICERLSDGSWWAMVQLGAAYENGENMPKDLAKAEYWYTTAASLGSPSAHYALGAMTANGNRLGTWEEAARLFERAAYAFFPEAEAAFGLALMTGRGVSKDHVEGAYWMTRATLHGSAWGKYLLAKAYLSGLGVPRDEEIGRTLMAEAERSGYRPIE